MGGGIDLEDILKDASPLSGTVDQFFTNYMQKDIPEDEYAFIFTNVLMHGAFVEHGDAESVPNDGVIPAGTELVMDGTAFTFDDETFTFWGTVSITDACNYEKDFGSGHITGRLAGLSCCLDVAIEFSTEDGTTTMTAKVTEADGTENTYESFFRPGPSGSPELEGKFSRFLDALNADLFAEPDSELMLTEDNSGEAILSILFSTAIQEHGRDFQGEEILTLSGEETTISTITCRFWGTCKVRASSETTNNTPDYMAFDGRLQVAISDNTF